MLSQIGLSLAGRAGLGAANQADGGGGDPGSTQPSLTVETGSEMPAMVAKMTQASRKFIATPANRMSSRLVVDAFTNARGSDDSPSSPSRRTKPPMGSQLSV